MQDEEEVAVVGAAAGAGAAADARDDEERRRERHHRQAEQPVTRPAAPDQVRADDEPDEEVERAGPRRPREAVGARGLARRAAPSARASRSARPRSPHRGAARRRVRERGLAVGEQRGPEEHLNHRVARLLSTRLAELAALQPLQLRRDDHDPERARSRRRRGTRPRRTATRTACLSREQLAQLAQARVDPLAGQLDAGRASRTARASPRARRGR